MTETDDRERLVRLVRIKSGVSISQDFRYADWPNCYPPMAEYEGEEYRYKAKDPNMEFTGTWNGSYWNCRADGYGGLAYGEKYGNGCIMVQPFDGCEIIG